MRGSVNRSIHRFLWSRLLGCRSSGREYGVHAGVNSVVVLPSRRVTTWSAISARAGRCVMMMTVWDRETRGDCGLRFFRFRDRARRWVRPGSGRWASLIERGPGRCAGVRRRKARGRARRFGCRSHRAGGGSIRRARLGRRRIRFGRAWIRHGRRRCFRRWTR